MYKSLVAKWGASGPNAWYFNGLRAIFPEETEHKAWMDWKEQNTHYTAEDKQIDMERLRFLQKKGLPDEPKVGIDGLKRCM